MTKLQIIGLGWAADALASMPQLVGSPYEDNNFCFLIQTPTCVYRFQRCHVSKKLVLFAHQRYKEPHWQIVPDLVAHKLDKLVLLTNHTSWGDLLWLAHLLRMEQQEVSTLLLKPFFQHNQNDEALVRRIKAFPPQLCIARGRGYNIYIDTPLPDPRDKPDKEEYSCLPFIYFYIQAIDRTQPLFAIQIKVSEQTRYTPASVSVKIKLPRIKHKVRAEDFRISPKQHSDNAWIIGVK